MNGQPSHAASRSALVVEGGAMRAVFSTGVLDQFLRERFSPFDLYVGVSAGAGNLAAFLAEMPGRNLKLYGDYSQRAPFKSFSRFLSGGHLLDLDWLWKTTISEIRLDLKTIYGKDRPLIVGMTDVQTGRAVYHETDAGDLEHVLKASSALPLFYRGFPVVNGRPMTDGGLTDAIPVAEAIRRGANHIMVIRSRPAVYRKHGRLMDGIAAWKLRHLTGLRRTMLERAAAYNRTVDLLRNPPTGIRILEVCAPESFRPSRLTGNVRKLFSGYRQGRRAGRTAVMDWMGGRWSAVGGSSEGNTELR